MALRHACQITPPVGASSISSGEKPSRSIASRNTPAHRPSSRPGRFSVGTRTSASSNVASSSARPSNQAFNSAVRSARLLLVGLVTPMLA